jgi:hypothetical protein
MKRGSNTPKRKRLTRETRLIAAKIWVKSYNGKKIISGYSKWFGVNKICAIKELRLLGISISEDLEKQIRKSLQEKKTIKMEPIINNDSDENFAFIAGYTSGGAPFGITHEEIEKDI